jgi:hypothetical protein
MFIWWSCAIVVKTTELKYQFFGTAHHHPEPLYFITNFAQAWYKSGKTNREKIDGYRYHSLFIRGASGSRDIRKNPERDFLADGNVV